MSKRNSQISGAIANQNQLLWEKDGPKKEANATADKRIPEVPSSFTNKNSLIEQKKVDLLKNLP